MTETCLLDGDAEVLQGVVLLVVQRRRSSGSSYWVKRPCVCNNYIYVVFVGLAARLRGDALLRPCWPLHVVITCLANDGSMSYIMPNSVMEEVSGSLLCFGVTFFHRCIGL
jgi:hypothetical protein